MPKITSFSQLDPNGYYTYADYVTWQFQERVELIKGKLFKMSPSPKRYHQGISRNLLVHIAGHLDGKKCKIYNAPFDVVLSQDAHSTVVQPDICAICDTTILTDKGCSGAPELIIEILSPGNSRKGEKRKI